MLTDEQRKAQIQALITEREGYVRFGRTDRVQDVDRQLKALGHEAKTPQKRATKLKQKRG